MAVVFIHKICSKRLEFVLYFECLGAKRAHAFNDTALKKFLVESFEVIVLGKLRGPLCAATVKYELDLQAFCFCLFGLA